ncbi:hypothetical protein ACLOJK_003581 [Asimina triloba]
MLGITTIHRFTLIQNLSKHRFSIVGIDLDHLQTARTVGIPSRGQCHEQFAIAVKLFVTLGCPATLFSFVEAVEGHLCWCVTGNFR